MKLLKVSLLLCPVLVILSPFAKADENSIEVACQAWVVHDVAGRREVVWQMPAGKPAPGQPIASHVFNVPKGGGKIIRHSEKHFASGTPFVFTIDLREFMEVVAVGDKHAIAVGDVSASPQGQTVLPERSEMRFQTIHLQKRVSEAELYDAQMSCYVSKR